MFVNYERGGVNLSRVTSYKVREKGMRLWFSKDHFVDLREPDSAAVLSALRANAAKQEPEPWSPELGPAFIG